MAEGSPAPSLHLPRVFRTWENQRWYPLKGWSGKLLPTDRPSWSDEAGKQATPRDAFPLPPQHTWLQEWAPVLNQKPGGAQGDAEDIDADGWMYAVDFPRTWHGAPGKSKVVRRREWTRAALPRPVDSKDFDDGDFVRVAQQPPVGDESPVHVTTMSELMSAGGGGGEAPSNGDDGAFAGATTDAPLPVVDRTGEADETKFNALLHKFADDGTAGDAAGDDDA